MSECLSEQLQAVCVCVCVDSKAIIELLNLEHNVGLCVWNFNK